MRYLFSIKWAKGFYLYDGGGTGRPKVIPVDAPALQSEAACVDQGARLAIRYAGGDVPDTITLDLADFGTLPALGDRIATFDGDAAWSEARITKRRVERFNNGHARLVPTVGPPNQTVLDRQNLSLKRSAAGTDGGRNATYTPVRTVDSGIVSGQLTAPAFDSWSWSQINLTDGHIKEVKDEAVLLTKITSTLSLEDSSASVPHDFTYFFYVNDLLVSYMVHPGGESKWRTFGHALLLPGQNFMVSIGSLGSNSLADVSGVKALIQFDTAPGQLHRAQESIWVT